MATASDPFAAYGAAGQRDAIPIDFAALAGSIAERLFDKPNARLSSKTVLRFGNHGSLAVNVEDGTYFDHEVKQGGGMLGLIERVRHCDTAGAFAWLEEQGLKDRRPSPERHTQILPVYYDYADEAGEVIFRVRRSSDKRFMQLGPDGRGGFHAKSGCMSGVRRVPYRLPELVAADPARAVFIVEGEKDADRLMSLGLVATCNSQGAGKFGAELTEHFSGRKVVVVADNDDAGRDHATDVARKLTGVAEIVTILELPGLPPKGDVSNWLDLGGDVEGLKGLARESLDNPTVAVGAANDDSPPSDARPIIRIRAGELHLMASEAEDALIATGAPLYVRGGLVRPVVDDMPAAHGRRTRVARLLPVDADMLVDHLSRVAGWERFNARQNAYMPTDPPHNVAATILSRDGEWRLPQLSGVITAPTLRPDGTILSEAGYDPETRLLLMEPPELPAIPEKPSKDDAVAAIGKLDALLDGFPFVDAQSRSVALSALITPVVRGAMPVAPLHASTAPVAGSGKSYLWDLASTILTGERAPVIAAGRTEEETEKRLAAALLNGQAIVSIDNVNGQLGGDALCQMIERPVVAIRPLGVSKLVKIENRATAFATGNNIQLVGDMTRRTILCSLDPMMERPELRQFKTNPIEMILRDRGGYIAAALVVVRAYIVAGRPGELPPLASFEMWSRLVRSAIVWLGYADPIMTMDVARADDPVLSQLNAVLRSWHGANGASERTTGAIVEAAQVRNTFGQLVEPDLYAAVFDIAEDRRGGLSAKRLGHFLGQHQGRIVDGMRAISGFDTHAKQKMWRIECV